MGAAVSWLPVPWLLQRALWWEQRYHPTLKWALLSFLWLVNTARVPPRGETLGSELVGRW